MSITYSLLGKIGENQMAKTQPVIGNNSAPGFAANTEIMFSNHKGKYKKSIERRQLKFAQSLPDLNRFLEQDEKVQFIAQGCSPMGIFEQYITGLIIIYIKRAVFVFTNKRIFHIPTTRSYKYRNSIAEIRYADCELIRLSWGGTLIVKYKNGKTEKFVYISGGERKKIKNLLKGLTYDGLTSATQTRNHLCPRCTKMLEKGNYTCPNCRLPFKSRDEGRKISIIYPGGGYFYTGHPFMGLADALVEVLLILLFAGALADMAYGVEGAIIDVIVIGVFLTFEKLVSIYHSNHFLEEYIPKDKEIRSLDEV